MSKRYVTIKPGTLWVNKNGAAILVTLNNNNMYLDHDILTGAVFKGGAVMPEFLPHYLNSREYEQIADLSALLEEVIEA